MKKIILISLLFLIPSFVGAVWYNPLSWFDKPKKLEISSKIIYQNNPEQSKLIDELKARIAELEKSLIENKCPICKPETVTITKEIPVIKETIKIKEIPVEKECSVVMPTPTEQDKQILISLLQQKANQLSAVKSSGEQIISIQNQINAIIAEYDKKIEDARNAMASMSFIYGRIAKLEQEKQSKLSSLYQQLQTASNQYNISTNNPVSLVIPQKTSIPQYLTFYPNSSGGGDIYDSSGTFHIRVEKTYSGDYQLYFNQ